MNADAKNIFNVDMKIITNKMGILNFFKHKGQLEKKIMNIKKDFEIVMPSPIQLMI